MPSIHHSTAAVEELAKSLSLLLMSTWAMIGTLGHMNLADDQERQHAASRERILETPEVRSKPKLVVDSSL